MIVDYISKLLEIKDVFQLQTIKKKNTKNKQQCC